MHAYAHSAPLPLATATRNLGVSLVLRQPKEKEKKRKSHQVTAGLTNPIIYFLSQKKKVRSQSSDPIIMSTIWYVLFNEFRIKKSVYFEYYLFFK